MLLFMPSLRAAVSTLTCSIYLNSKYNSLLIVDKMHSFVDMSQAPKLLFTYRYVYLRYDGLRSFGWNLHLFT